MNVRKETATLISLDMLRRAELSISGHGMPTFAFAVGCVMVVTVEDKPHVSPKRLEYRCHNEHQSIGEAGDKKPIVLLLNLTWGRGGRWRCHRECNNSEHATMGARPPVCQGISFNATLDMMSQNFR